MHNQTSTNDSECSGTTGLQRAQKSPWHTSLHLPACTGCRLWLASSSSHWCLHIEQPQTQHPPTSTHFYESTFPPEVWDLLVSNTLWCHHREAQNHFQEHFRLPFLAGGMILQPLSEMLIPWPFSSDSWKLTSFVTIWLHLTKKNNSSYLFFNLFLSSLYLFEQCLKLGIMSTSCVYLPL